MFDFLKRLFTRIPPPATLTDESGALWSLSLMISTGLTGLFFYALQAPFTFFATFTTSVMIAGAGLIVGGLIGFLFGIPRTLQSESPIPNRDLQHADDNSPSVAYQANTNLEQISDWLTKILVGVGLTQLANLWDGLQTAAAVIQPGLGEQFGAMSMAIGILIYFPVCGFLFAYLWTRLFLAGAFRKADLATLTHRAEEKAIIEVTKTLTRTAQGRASVETTAALAVAPDGAFATSTPTSEKRRGLWVDDIPSNNTAIKQSFEKLQNITFDLSLSTEDALRKVKSSHYDVIISDMSRPPDPRAGYTLLDQLQADKITIPFIIFAARGGDPANRAEAQQHKAFGLTNSPQELLGFLHEALNQ